MIQLCTILTPLFHYAGRDLTQNVRKKTCHGPRGKLVSHIYLVLVPASSYKYCNSSALYEIGIVSWEFLKEETMPLYFMVTKFMQIQHHS